MPKTLYERDMEDSLRQIAVALGVDVSGTPDVEEVIRAAINAGKDAERYRWLRKNAITLEDFAYYVDEEVEAFVDEQMAAALAAGAA